MWKGMSTGRETGKETSTQVLESTYEEWEEGGYGFGVVRITYFYTLQ